MGARAAAPVGPLVLLCLVVWHAGAAEAELLTRGEARFFSGCPSKPQARLHSERSAWDLHAMTFSALGVGEVEVLRAADWTLDLLLPGGPWRPFRSLVERTRAAYARLPRWTPVRRFGELVNALQIPELSLGDANATYTTATGGEIGLGGGLLIRINKLVDWTQHVAGDVNRGAGRLARARRGRLVRWRGPERLVDTAQLAVTHVAHQAQLLLARLLEGGLTGVELGGERVVNLWRPVPHREQAVFVRLPMAVYRAHELWILERRQALVVGPPVLFLEHTHAELAHGHRPSLPEWAEPDRYASEPVLVVMGPERILARAPAALRRYAVPAAWIVDPRGVDNRPVEPLS